ncbi:ABC transporter substrate-binding protein [Alkalihalobacillus trypoxylicola]|uniref:Iron ABC transporter substrate-binding protein n=1 Tax=Alkalihalobacillus trypoxylicola TaxID=519424 RepID=A0A161P820_9BACI|nr:iron-siderophore ABC transporter substrate-binding protein [Alkalihalobacillus trypoxylicola]KYG28258.1 iron ABC transporter substrate-binding protein [Alkalihalobacillus trypoxylicola]
MLHKKLIIPIFLIFTMILLVGCQTATEDSEEIEKTEAENTEETEQAENSEGNIRSVENALGVTDIEGEPQRIVTLYQGATDTAVAMGIKPVGMVESWLEKPVYQYLRDDLEDVSLVGEETQPNLEEIAKLNPDLIIASKIRHEEIFEQLSQIAPTVADESLYNFKETTLLMGEALNQQDVAAQLIEDWDNRVVDFQNKAEEQIENWPMHVSVLNFRADHARIYVTGFAGSILTELGFNGPKNLEGSDEEIMLLTDQESIPQMNADVFYIFMNEDEAVKETYEDWISHPLWGNLDAVQANQSYIVDEVIWNMGGGILAANLMLDDIYDRLELTE